MSEQPESNGKTSQALDLAINFLKEHEQTIDELIDKLATVNEQYSSIAELNQKLDQIEKKADALEKNIQKLANCLH